MIALKVFAGGIQDMADAASVVEVQGEALDKNLAYDLCKGFGPPALSVGWELGIQTK